ncbi:hypothetical protein BgramDRAFT_4788 [Paraburkholderia graminis C4D1M]|uniref:Uncharacterized protein n=1 Tax=Paraburkholderia graminis (strain ATCC 700544 / DSM 17151 / LMG 18924 / NCIMB 13744 / C4D1M) TaxID=396598 RepID=B1G612_PARG4|nr:hypothetical protein BgramDRAFT_4788 [Paraburkholderia graminis C4D1M]
MYPPHSYPQRAERTYLFREKVELVRSQRTRKADPIH